MKPVRAASLALIALAPLVACGGGGSTSDDEHYDCAMEDRADTFVVGLEKVSPSGLHFRLMQSNPAPPSRGDNDFTLQIADGAGAPVTGATLTVVPYMPDHGHGTSVPVVISESTTVPGQYDFNPVNLWMPGLWQVLVTKDTEQVIFAFCIPG